MTNTNPMPKRINAAIDSILSNYLNEFQPIAVSDDAQFDTIKKAVSSVIDEAFASNNGGKFVRGLTFAKRTFSGIEGQNLDDITKQILDIAAAIEIFQTAMLVHDDIIDNDQTRRGRAASHIILGTGKAIILGDLLLSCADNAFTSNCAELFEWGIIKRDVFNELIFCWNVMKRDVLYGQIMDIDQAQINLNDINKNEWGNLSQNAMLINSMKTASYTTVAPIIFSDLIVRNSVLITDDFGEEISKAIASGQSFQVSNDVDGIEKDIKENNISSGLIMALSELSKANNEPTMQTIIDIFTKGKNATADEISQVKKIIEDEVLQD